MVTIKILIQPKNGEFKTDAFANNPSDNNYDNLIPLSDSFG